MKMISHRGNVTSKAVDMENTIPYINYALKMGYDVEIDVWLVGNKLFLGHDNPQHEIDTSYLINDRLLCHAKNKEAFSYMLDDKRIHCFWHDKDDYTLSSKSIPIVYPNKPPIKNSIVMVTDHSVFESLKNSTEIYGICYDYIGGKHGY